jgi:hypothetical protein
MAKDGISTLPPPSSVDWMELMNAVAVSLLAGCTSALPP